MSNDPKKQREIDKREAQLLCVEEKLGKDAADAIRDYLSLFDERCYIWMANLYDPATGAEHHSGVCDSTL